MLSYNNCRAEIVPVKASQDYADTDWAAIQLQLETMGIQQTLADFGVSSTEINNMMQQLNPEDVHKVALNMNQVMPAGDSVAIIVGILIIVILVIVILKLMNKEERLNQICFCEEQRPTQSSLCQDKSYSTNQNLRFL